MTCAPAETVTAPGRPPLGPAHCREPNDGRAISTFIRQALTGRPLPAGDGNQTRSVCYVDDLVEGVSADALRRPRSDQHRHSGGDVGARSCAPVLEVTGSSSSTKSIPRPQDDPHVRQPDVALARKVLGWKPDGNIADGPARTVEWFASGLQPVAFECATTGQWPLHGS
ncbi:NAD-dependent epimerase/dehydratase family protein [Geodermatophilus africanus]|uniref:NAD-dependent epimerase/dehydratase family protein n=1 Tax=Geodermatophilus africanus TaxID=1137993 RepID=UPI001B8D165D